MLDDKLSLTDEERRERDRIAAENKRLRARIVAGDCPCGYEGCTEYPDCVLA